MKKVIYPKNFSNSEYRGEWGDKIKFINNTTITNKLADVMCLKKYLLFTFAKQYTITSTSIANATNLNKPPPPVALSNIVKRQAQSVNNTIGVAFFILFILMDLFLDTNDYDNKMRIIYELYNKQV